MRPSLVAALACPLDGAPLELAGRALSCPDGHSTDLARQGYANLLVGPAPAAADTTSMVAARVRLQAAGLHDPIGTHLGAAVEEHGGRRPALVVDVGAGTGHHLAQIVEATDAGDGLAVDISKHAARRAARSHPRVGAIVADVWAGLPIRSSVADVVLDVFAPRDTAEFARILRSGGLAVVVTPTPAHLTPLVDGLGLVRVADGKTDRLDAVAAAHFEQVDRGRVRWERDLDREALEDVVASGPSAHHVGGGELAAAITALGPPVTVVFEVDVTVLRRR